MKASKLAVNETGPLNVTREAHHRVFVGLGWDPKAKAGIKDKIGAMMGGKKTFHDLDLSCFVYDSSQNFIAKIGAKSEQSLDKIGQIYHSGDNVEGVGEGDDEQISVELKNLGPDIHSIIFLVTIQSGHSFADIESPEIRLADGYSNYSFLSADFSGPEAQNSSAFIFAAITRDESYEWVMKNICAYTNEPTDKSWEHFLTQYL